MQPFASLAACNTFGLDAHCRYLITADSVPALVSAIIEARNLDLPWLLLGGGSNVLFIEDFAGVVIRLRTRGIVISDNDDDSVLIHVEAGENWHEVVCYALAQRCYGLENLALIPGSAGAAPVQNIGAYGVELSDVLAYVDVLDLDTLRVRRMCASDCQLAYRDSIFKGQLRARVVITAIGLRLCRQARPVIDYPSLREMLGQTAGQASAETVFEAVCSTRRQRLPDPAHLGNAGSFFKNPLVPALQHQQLLRRYPDLPAFSLLTDPSQYKLPAAWLIDHLGWKGLRRGCVGVHERQALVLVNHGGASGSEVWALASDIMASVAAEFGIDLQAEVRIIAARGEYDNSSEVNSGER